MKKKRINEKMGGGSRIGLGGVNSTGTSDNRYSTKHPTGYHTGGYQGNADSQFSQRLGLISTLEEEIEEIDYKEDQNMLEEEDLMEFFARIMKMPLTESEKEAIIKDISLEKEDEEDIDEISGVAALGGGPVTPLGTNAKGKVPSSKERNDRMKSADIYKKYRN
jgi:hypothetical protein